MSSSADQSVKIWRTADFSLLAPLTDQTKSWLLLLSLLLLVLLSVLMPISLSRSGALPTFLCSPNSPTRLKGGRCCYRRCCWFCYQFLRRSVVVFVGLVVIRSSADQSVKIWRTADFSLLTQLTDPTQRWLLLLLLFLLLLVLSVSLQVSCCYYWLSSYSFFR